VLHHQRFAGCIVQNKGWLVKRLPKRRWPNLDKRDAIVYSEHARMISSMQIGLAVARRRTNVAQEW
jgi:hypothetical protein